MRIVDHFKSDGVLEINVFAVGVLVDHWTDENLIVGGAKSLMAKLIAGDTTDAIAEIGFGTGAIPAAPGDEALTAAHWRPLLGFDYPAPGKVRFLFELGVTEANGMDIREFGLRTVAGTLFSRKVRGTIEKSEDISLSGSWTITY